MPEIENDPSPDNPILDMFAECQTGHYLLQKGFCDLTYFRQNNVDYQAKFDNRLYHVEGTYLHGPDFKIFGDSNPDLNLLKPGEKWDYSRKLTNFLKTKYSNKELQFTKRNLNPADCLLIMITDLCEFQEPWFLHAKSKGIHPILHFILTQKIATVVIGPATTYEPDAKALYGVFGKLKKFSWDEVT